MLDHSSDSQIAVHAPGKPGLIAAWPHSMRWALAATMVILGQPAGAADVYKCRDAGKISYTSNPTSSTRCQPVDLKVIEPDPAEVARALEDKRRKAEEESAAEERARQERLVRAREIEAQAALRRARAAEEEARIQRLREQEATDQWGYPVWGYPIWRPHPHPHFKRRFDSHPGFPPTRPEQAAPNTELHFSIGSHRPRGK